MNGGFATRSVTQLEESYPGIMCTLSWLSREDGYELFANRDELLTRGIAIPPSVRESRGVQYIAPVDSDFGGTWIATNEFGVSFCLLNRPRKREYTNARSRGLLVLDLAVEPSVEATRKKLERDNLHQYPPFALAVLGVAHENAQERGTDFSVPSGKPLSLDERLGVDRAVCPPFRLEPLVFEWDGDNLRVDHVDRPPYLLTSSSYDPGGVTEHRSRQFVECRGVTFDANSSEELLALHRSHIPEAGPYSICMHREDAETVSFSHVVVAGDSITFSYTPAAPCQNVPATTTTLRMVKPAGQPA